MKLSHHEQTLATVTVLAILFGILGLKLKPGLEEWRERTATLETLRRVRTESRNLIDQGPQWRENYESFKDQMPVFEPGRQVDTYWMSIMDRLADEFKVSITRRQVGREVLVGDVYEFSTDCQWEAPLDAFTRFLCAMQDAGAMLDVRELVIRTNSTRKGYLRGSFTLYCAYMRGEPIDSTPQPDSSPTPTNAPALSPEPSSPSSESPSESPSETPSHE